MTAKKASKLSVQELETSINPSSTFRVHTTLGVEFVVNRPSIPDRFSRYQYLLEENLTY